MIAFAKTKLLCRILPEFLDHPSYRLFETGTPLAPQMRGRLKKAVIRLACAAESAFHDGPNAIDCSALLVQSRFTGQGIFRLRMEFSAAQVQSDSHRQEGER